MRSQEKRTTQVKWRQVVGYLPCLKGTTGPKLRLLDVGRETQITGCSDIARQTRRGASLGCLLVCTLLKLERILTCSAGQAKHICSPDGACAVPVRDLWLRKKMLEQSRHLVMAPSYWFPDTVFSGVPPGGLA